MTKTFVALALLAGCNNQNRVEPADAAPEQPVEAKAPEAPEAPAADQMMIPERGDDAERASKNGKLEHAIGDAKVVVTFGRPEARGREIFGGIVSYGSIWRTGADEASVFAVDQDVTVQGEALAKGVYALFTIPGEVRVDGDLQQASEAVGLVQVRREPGCASRDHDARAGRRGRGHGHPGHRRGHYPALGRDGGSADHRSRRW